MVNANIEGDCEDDVQCITFKNENGVAEEIIPKHVNDVNIDESGEDNGAGDANIDEIGEDNGVGEENGAGGANIDVDEADNSVGEENGVGEDNIDEDYVASESSFEDSEFQFSEDSMASDCKEHDPHIKTSQAQMVYYMNDKIDKDLIFVVHLKPRDLYDMGDLIDIKVCLEQKLDQVFGDSDNLSLIREDVDDELISEGNVNDDIDGDELMLE
ncbi:unnamed protein product [Vicia faba]|uniref:Uncharacterized protein n=1 Tax=Vicia faba TaxID=3906 RepID=A0AAV1AEF4_VICFA|nr:unnamed protein product [Vicia faba]